MSGKKMLESVFRKHGFDDFKWLDPKDIVVAHWVRMKCIYGCPNYGKGGCCPPNVPSVEECEAFFKGYKEAVVFHFEKKMKNPEDRHRWTTDVNKKLLALEREVFLSGHWKAFLLYMDSCHACDECAGSRLGCKNKPAARPAPEALAMDVFSTVKKLGYPIQVLKDYSQSMNRYAFLMIE